MVWFWNDNFDNSGIVKKLNLATFLKRGVIVMKQAY